MRKRHETTALVVRYIVDCVDAAGVVPRPAVCAKALAISRTHAANIYRRLVARGILSEVVGHWRLDRCPIESAPGDAAQT